MQNIFSGKKTIIGMIHVGALPGAPCYEGSFAAVRQKALLEARLYKDAGVDMLAIENMHDVPYLNRTAGHETTAAMAVIGHEVKNAACLPCGIQILAGANKQALAAAAAAGLDFIRAEGFVFAHVADEGSINSDAGELLRYRREIGAEKVRVFTDIKKKHSSHAITADVSIAETAKAAEFFLSDGVIVTGAHTGAEASLEEIRAVKAAVEIPVLVGSGVTLDNLDSYLEAADALIVGSYFKTDGYWRSPLDAGRVAAFMKRANALRK
ncbi:MAG TPA: BtpA/SgcQ family protein [Elusimicrobiales bacterium]|nr:BtpA/SgcQ family protein [Elusimicrobiales bacterium]